MTPAELETIKIALDNGLEINDEAIRLLISHIKELESRIPRWIPVEERMPEGRAIVTACIKNRRVFPDVFYTEGCWYSDKGIVKGITHWQPLPKGPEE